MQKESVEGFEEGTGCSWCLQEQNYQQGIVFSGLVILVGVASYFILKNVNQKANQSTPFVLDVVSSNFQNFSEKT